MKIKKELRPIILVGKGGSGKDYLADTFKRHGYGVNVSATTRPMREGETHMDTYNYMSNRRFLWLKFLGKFHETKKFNGWRYGTLKSEWKKKHVFIFTPSGLDSLPVNDWRNSIVVYLDIAPEVRMKRLKNRDDDNHIRRMAADHKDFTNGVRHRNPDVHITDPEFDAKEVMMWTLRLAGEEEIILGLLQ